METLKSFRKKTLLIQIVLTVILTQSVLLAEDPPAKATEPIPSDGAVQVRVNHNLFWTAGSGATSHDVYFGTSSPPAFVTNTSDPNYDPGGLEYNTLYYWRIDEINSGGTTTGDPWSFTTRPAPMDMEGFHLKGGMFLRLSGQGEVDCPEAYRVLKQMKRLGCTWMCLLINEMQEDADTIAPSYHQWTHYPSEIEAVVNEAKNLGLKTMIRLSKPQYYENALDAGKEDLLDPEGWFATYANYANKYADIAEDVGVDIFCAGSELHDAFLQGYDSEWTSVINGVRARYNGPLYFTMAGNSFLKNGNSIPFWNQLDYIGINAYFKLTMIDTGNCVYTEGDGSYNPTPQELMDQYACAMNNIQDFRNSAGLTDMPVIYGEGGYRSTDGCNMKIKVPPIDMQEQFDCVNAMMTKAPKRDWFKGMNFWQFSSWDDEGGQVNINHGVRGKKAQDTFVRNYMAIDRFENYDHAESAAISDNWSLINGTATMTLETTEVHGGDSSMKVSYDTTSSLCKIQRALAEASDWSGDYSHITLWFKGDTNRTGEDLTLKVIGPTGLIGDAVYAGGAGMADWTRWEIDLNSDLTGGTGDLTSVKSIRFHLPSGGGSGTLYLDEIIRLPLKAVPTNPFDTATDVCPNKDLFWRSGYEAQSHNVYFGFSSTAVDNATTDSDEFLGNTTFPSFRLSCIDTAMTCYWRVDEIAPDESVTKGDVWSFTTRDYTLGDFEDEETGDTIQVRRRWKHITGTMTNTVVETDSHTGSKSLEIVYDNSSEDCMIRRGHHNDYRPWNEETTSVGIWVKGNAANTGDIVIQLIHQDATIVAQKTFTNATQNTNWTWLAITESDFTPADLFGVRYLAIAITQASGSGGTVYLDDVSRITGKPAIPRPADGAMGVDVDDDLHWNRATDSDSHDVYFGTDQTAVDNATTSSNEYMGNVTGSSFNLRYALATLDDDTDYYWRVDSIKGAVTTKGNVWTFSTGGSSGPPQQTEF
ncbi:MAG: glycoside hydrolase family 113, partial [Planctomycetota bacterium]